MNLTAVLALWYNGGLGEVFSPAPNPPRLARATEEGAAVCTGLLSRSGEAELDLSGHAEDEVGSRGFGAEGGGEPSPVFPALYLFFLFSVGWSPWKRRE